MRRPPITFSSRQQAVLIRLLGVLQARFESEIECHTVPPAFNGEAMPEFKDIVALARRDWRLAEDLILHIERKPRPRA